MKKYKTAIYCRLSKEDGDKVVSNSIQGQVDYCLDFLHRQSDLDLAYPPFCDDGYSGLSLHRPAFLAMDQLIKSGDIDCVICRDLSRFTRDFIGGGAYLEEFLPKMGVRFIAINNCDTLKDAPQTLHLLLPLVNFINDCYSRDTSSKIRSSLSIKRKKGDFVGAFPPFGYHKKKENPSQLVIDPVASQVVALAFTLFQEGSNFQQIADTFHQMGILTPLEYKYSENMPVQSLFLRNNSSKWHPHMVKRILTHDIYKGNMTQGKTSRPNYKIKKSLNLPSKEWITVENTHESIISPCIFDRIQVFLQRNPRISSHLRSPLTGFLFCGHCHAPMCIKTISRNSRNYYYVVCSLHKKNGQCSPTSISLPFLEELVQNVITNQLDFSENNLHTPLLSMPFSFPDHFNRLQENLYQYTQISQSLEEDFKAEIISKEEYHLFYESYQEKIQQTENALLFLKETFPQPTTSLTILSRRLLLHFIDKIVISSRNQVDFHFLFNPTCQRRLSS